MTRRPRPEPARCACMSSADSLSTHRGARHLTKCRHSTLRDTTKPFTRVHFKRLPGTRGVTPALDTPGVER